MLPAYTMIKDVFTKKMYSLEMPTESTPVHEIRTPAYIAEYFRLSIEPNTRRAVVTKRRGGSEYTRLQGDNE